MLRKALIGDVKTIHGMINVSSGKEEILPRSLMDIYSNLRDFFVYLDEDGEPTHIVGICAMSIFWENLAEIRSLYVDREYRKRGIGRKLVEACLSEAITLELFRVFTLTKNKEFFARLGFREVDRATLSEKIWSDCFRCSKYPDYCDEVAMIREL
ncbi:MAG: GNAT family N-acetyltransferase [Syntrophaceae bacterium CG2_30_49_12]|nr:MAG: GNAT family N-acetyltransferase [Syntrophaceae bacterium CG2_30_49_12]PIP05860.1 MAG: GNAT family N-acetyltransferase [Syntrophobacterales bacterium CG23_combo_of_CG06-09_8_20_14_all_48_27]PJA48657.1 MAG: GNAT family N-acetyltransferase [Syntrophobacterales bacterium CG_4_9_14_3_um_filter_49_8]